MTLDFWGLGLQAVNVLILVWLLTRVFWRPVAAAIVARQTAAQALLSDAEGTQAKADAALAEVTKAREEIAAERASTLASAAQEAEVAVQAKIAEARAKAEALVEAAKVAQGHAAEAARKEQTQQAATLAVEIAGKLLARLDPKTVQGAFLAQLVAAVEGLPEQDRAALTHGGTLVSAAALDDAGKARIAEALGKMPDLTFVVDPALIAGFVLRTQHVVLHDSWQSDLDHILKDLRHAA